MAGADKLSESLPTPLEKSLHRARSLIREAKLASVLAVLGLLLANCGLGSGAAGPAANCEGKEDSKTDLSREPDYDADYVSRWVTKKGCAVRLDIILMRSGEGYCGGQTAAEIMMGTPLGRSHRVSEPRVYIRDPTDVFGDARVSRAFAADTELPRGAIPTHLRQDGYELWTVSSGRFIYLESERTVQKWPLDRSPPGCA